MKSLFAKTSLLALLLTIVSFGNSLFSQELEFSGVKRIENKEQVKFSILGINNLEELDLACRKLEKIKGLSVKSFDLRNNVASVLVESSKHISATEVRETLLSLGYDLTSISVKANNSSVYKSIRQKEKELSL